MGKMTFFGFVEDNDVPESTRIPVYMGVQPIKLKNSVPPDSIQGNRVGFIHFHMNMGGVWPKKPIFHRFASSSLGSSERSMVTPHFLFRFCCAMVPPSQNAVLGGCKIIIHAPGDKEKWEK